MAFAKRATEKKFRVATDRRTVVPIDKVNVCPIIPSENKYHSVQNPLWELLDANPALVTLGHVTTGGRRHYSCYVDPVKLAEARLPDKGGLLLKDVIVKDVSNLLLGAHYSPGDTVILHPPLDQSHIREIVEQVEEEIGAEYRVVIHNETFSIQTQYSTFLDHGIKLEKGCVVILDDGSNTGNTLMAMLNAAAKYKPKFVVAVVLVSRLPVYKRDLFALPFSFDYVTNGIKVLNGVWLGIPVYSAEECPMCDMHFRLQELGASRTVFSPYAAALSDAFREVDGHGVDGQGDGDGILAPTPGGVQRIVRLREELELSAVSQRLSEFAQKIVLQAVGMAGAIEEIVCLASLMLTEPHLIQAPLLKTWLDRLLESSLSHAMECRGNERVKLLFFGFLCLVEMDEVYWDEKMAWAYRYFGMRLLEMDVGSRQEDDILPEQDLSSALCLILAYATRRGRSELKERAVANALFAAVRERWLRFRIDPSLRTQTWSLILRDAALLLASGGAPQTAGECAMGGSDLLALAAEVAGHIWMHASVGMMTGFNEAERSIGAALRKRTRELVKRQAITLLGLEDFRERLRFIQSQIGGAVNEHDWLNLHLLSADMDKAVRVYQEALFSLELAVVENSEEDVVRGRLQYLRAVFSRVVDEGKQCFSEIFPKISDVVQAEWTFCDQVAKLPEQCVDVVQDELAGKDDVRVFMPEEIVKQFLTVCMENFVTRAFAGVPMNVLRSEGRVGAYVRRVVDRGDAFVELGVVDNGGGLRKGVIVPGNRRALRNREAMVKAFGGSLLFPVEERGRTRVALRMRERFCGGID